MLKVTIAKWYTPGGRNIDKNGFVPDTVVTLTAADIDAGNDPQMAKALELAR
jgi:carboxyl-terminal processing protease